MLRGTLLSLAIVAAAWLVLVCGRWLLDRLLPPVVTEDIEVSPIQSRVAAYRPVAGSGLRKIVVGLAGYHAAGMGHRHAGMV